MTREEREDAIDIIQSILNKYEEDECLVTEITIGDEDIKAFKMAIKALGQEPVIDKIRAEVETEKLEDSPNFCIKAHNNAVDRVLKIIDKYKAETEE